MTVTLGAQPEHGFDEPLGLLSDCHRRIERFLQIMLTVLERTDKGRSAFAPEERQALEGALTYFAIAAPRHTDDEEDSLFPRMRACDNRAAHQTMARIDALEADHRKADALHEEVAQICRQWLGADQSNSCALAQITISVSRDDFERLHHMLIELRDLYAHHIAIEDNEVFPLAQHLLSEAELAQVGREMARRRGVQQDSRT